MENQAYALKELEVGSPEWKEYRRSRVSASEVPIVLGFSKYCTPAQLFWKKVNAIDEHVDNRHTRRGIAAEPRIIREIQATIDPAAMPNSKLAQSLHYPWLTATLDAIGPTTVYEVKCPEKAWTIAPLHYVWQLRAQLLVVGRTKGLLVEGEESGAIRNLWGVELFPEHSEMLLDRTSQFVDGLHMGEFPIHLW